MSTKTFNSTQKRIVSSIVCTCVSREYARRCCMREVAGTSTNASNEGIFINVCDSPLDTTFIMIDQEAPSLLTFYRYRHRSAHATCIASCQQSRSHTVYWHSDSSSSSSTKY
eukprot:4396-Heterococcus_DN1.PRE.2